MDKVLAIILGGGRGTRLYPLTKYRAKPALPLAGKYRLIDIPVSNCINSDITKMFVLTQFNSASLNQHIASTYRFSPFSKGFVHLLAATQTMENPDWFQGTADAVRKTITTMKQWNAKEYLILSGDHLYRMDYRLFMEYHRQSNADVTISVVPIEATQASSFGLMKIDSSGKVVDFKEKPKGDVLEDMKVDTQSLGLDAESAKKKPFIASMGIYVFKAEVLFDLLKEDHQQTDFGKDIIPAAIKKFNVHTYLFDGYWEDIGTIDAFYHANMKLVKQPKPEFSFFDVDFPIYTRPRFLPPSKILDSNIRETMVCDGCIIKSSKVDNSIIGIRSWIEAGTVIEHSLLMGLDYYPTVEEREHAKKNGVPAPGIGENTIIKNAIIDKNARVGKNVKITNKNNLRQYESEEKGYVIHDGITVVLKDAVIPDGTEI